MTGEIPSITLWVNGSLMWDVKQPKNDFIAGATEGMIGFQCHWSARYLPTPGGARRFRNVMIKELEME